AAGVGFEPTIEVAPDAGFQDVVLVFHTSRSAVSARNLSPSGRAMLPPRETPSVDTPSGVG
ncbi:MAG: hypothetical protein ACRDQZ_26500, partial [Mycobacteriales bacterium]